MPTYNDYQLSAFVDQFFQRFQRIEAQLILLSEKLGVPFDDPSAAVPSEVVELARAGDRVGALRRYRELTGAGPDEARDVLRQI
jgi:ribosomal protein L7/L12